METINIIRDYWVLIVFCFTMLASVVLFARAAIEGTRCSLRNDILDIYDRCKADKKITHYQLEAIKYSHSLYKKLKGNSFVDDVVNRVSQFEIVD